MYANPLKSPGIPTTLIAITPSGSVLELGLGRGLHAHPCKDWDGSCRTAPPILIAMGPLGIRITTHNCQTQGTSTMMGTYDGDICRGTDAMTLRFTTRATTPGNSMYIRLTRWHPPHKGRLESRSVVFTGVGVGLPHVMRVRAYSERRLRLMHWRNSVRKTMTNTTANSPRRKKPSKILTAFTPLPLALKCCTSTCSPCATRPLQATVSACIWGCWDP